RGKPYAATKNAVKPDPSTTMYATSTLLDHVRRPASLAITGTTLLLGTLALASSHSDAPLIKQDPQANLTDVYAFIGTKYNDSSQTVLNVLVSVRPFSEPGDGVIYERFADDA